MAHLKSFWALVALTLLFAVASEAKKKGMIKVYGDRYTHPEHPKEWLRTYVTIKAEHDQNTMPYAVGAELTNKFVRELPNLPVTDTIINLGEFGGGPADVNFTLRQLELPAHVPKVGKNPFNLLLWGQQNKGHPPLNIYDVPHVDFHFLFPDAKTWFADYNADNMGPCMFASPELIRKASLPINKNCWPGPVPGSGTGMHGSVGNFVWMNGIHLYDMSSYEWPFPGSAKPTSPFNYTFIWGQHGGELAYMEPMISWDLMLEMKNEVCVDITKHLPTMMPEARALPTEYCMIPGNRTWKIEYRKFIDIPGGCNDEEDQEQYGWWPYDGTPNFMGDFTLPGAAPLPEGCNPMRQPASE